MSTSVKKKNKNCLILLNYVSAAVSRFIGEDFHVLGKQIWVSLLEQVVGPDGLQRSLPASVML